MMRFFVISITAIIIVSLLMIPGCAQTHILGGEATNTRTVEHDQGSERVEHEHIIEIDTTAYATTAPADGVNVFDLQPPGVFSTTPAREREWLGQHGLLMPPRVTIAPDGSMTVDGNAKLRVVERGDTSKRNPRLVRNDSAGATGASVNATGSEATVGQANQPSKAGIDPLANNGIGGGGSATEAGASNTTAETKGPDWGAMLLYLMGGALVAGGVLAGVWLGRWKLGAGLIGGGLAVAALGTLVVKAWWVLPAVVGTVFAGLLVWLLVESGLVARSWTALTAVAVGVEDFTATNPGSGQAVKDKIARAAGAKVGVVRGAIRAIKAKAGIT